MKLSCLTHLIHRYGSSANSLLRIVFCLMLLFGTTSQASQVFVTGGGQYNIIQTGSADGSGDSYFGGLGYTVGLRWRLPFNTSNGYAPSTAVMGFDFFGLYSSQSAKNSADSSETLANHSFTFGVESWFYHFSFGTHYQRTSTDIVSPGNTNSFGYSGLGIRIGYSYPFMDRYEAQIGTSWTFAAAPGTTLSSSSKANIDHSIYLLIHFRLFSLESSPSYQQRLEPPSNTVSNW